MPSIYEILKAEHPDLKLSKIYIEGYCRTVALYTYTVGAFYSTFEMGIPCLMFCSLPYICL